MSIKSEKILSLLFPDIFEFDERHNEFCSKRKIEIKNNPFPVRSIFYLCYPKVRDSSEQFRLSKSEFNRIMDSDKEVTFIEFDGNFSEEPLNHLIKDDFDYLSLKDPKDRKYFEISKIVKYSISTLKPFMSVSRDSSVNSENELSDIEKSGVSSEWNINFFFRHGIFPVSRRFDSETFSKVADYDLLRSFGKNINYQTILKRFGQKSLKTLTEELNLDGSFLISEYLKLLKHSQKLLNDLSVLKSESDPDMIDPEELEKAIQKRNEKIAKIESELNDIPDFLKTLEFDEFAIRNSLNNCLSVGFLPKQKDLFIKYATQKNILELIKPFEQNGIPLDDIAKKLVSFDYLKLIQEFIRGIKRLTNPVYEIIKRFKPFTFSMVFRKIDWIPSENELKDFETFDFSFVQFVLDSHRELLNWILENLKTKDFKVILMWLSEMLQRKLDILDFIHSSLENLSEQQKEEKLDRFRNEFYLGRPLASFWIEHMKSEPPVEIYTNPLIYDLGREWRQNCSVEVPKEMTNKKYYDYMLKNGTKRPQNISAMYSYFSNSEFNKIIFVSTDDVLDKPAKLRFIIPVDFELVKEFLTESIDISGLCKFTRITNDDWNKISGGHDRIDTVAFSNVKNIYGEYSKLSEVIEFFKSAIEIKFNLNLQNTSEMN